MWKQGTRAGVASASSAGQRVEWETGPDGVEFQWMRQSRGEGGGGRRGGADGAISNGATPTSGGVRVWGAEASDDLSRKGTPTIRYGKARRGEIVGWEVREAAEERGEPSMVAPPLYWGVRVTELVKWSEQRISPQTEADPAHARGSETREDGRRAG